MQPCAALSESLNKSIPLVTRELAELISEGFVEDNGYAPSSGGRRPLVYSLKADRIYVLAVAMDQLFTRIAIMDLQNNYVSKPETLELDLHENDHALTELIRIINNHIRRSGIEKSRIAGAGIGMPGFVNNRLGINHTFLTDHLNGSGLREFLEKKLGLPVCIDNDSSLIALAELRFGLARTHKNVMVVNIGWGIGLGMIVDGELFRGHTGYAGEFSHIPTSDNDILCECGKRGCLETEASLLLVAQKAVAEITAGKTKGLKLMDTRYMGDYIMEAANKGDQFAIELLSETAYNLGKGIAILIHIMNPELIVLSGRGALAGKLFMAPIQHALNKYCIPRLAEHTALKVSPLGYDAQLTGAAALVMENFGIHQAGDRKEKKSKNIKAV